MAKWNDLEPSEREAMLRRLGDLMADGLTVSLRTLDGHLALALEEPRPPTLLTGGTDPLLPHLAAHIDGAREVDLAVAFALESGVALVEPYLTDLLDRGGRLRLVVGDYLDVTEPGALRRLLDLQGDVTARAFETRGGSFHPKAWAFRAQGASGAAIVGSSNLSRTALTSGVEWNLATADRAHWEQVGAAFEALLGHPQVRPLTSDWIDAYASRRRRQPLPAFARALTEAEPPAPPPEPHAIQAEALAALAQARAQGRRASLVVLATGLGKTWLAAFDSRPFDRVLFVAHREEILSQALHSFRRIRPEARLGLYTGAAKEDGDVVFASIQTLGRPGHLARFAPDAFDYVVVDEFHHASAASYRALLDHFRPRFLLGLTATPDRTDGADLLALCGDHLAYRCDLWDGIRRDLLSPFRYWGVADDVDYAQIPWRSGRFDEEALTAAVATQARARNALDHLAQHGDGPAIGFCVSRRHAEFMAEFATAAGLRAVAVHSGVGSAPRTSSLEALGRGEIDILFAVDMFNEGVDVPEIGTVLMLRPTESAILFLQQLGRGLRRLPGKVLRVIDYIGNHRSFLVRTRALLAAGTGDRSLAQRLDEVAAGEADLPEGCGVTYDLRAIDLLRSLTRITAGQDEGEAWYRGHVLREGRRPTATEFARAGFDPARTGHGTWFEFVADMGDPVPPEARAQAPLLGALERRRDPTACEVAMPLVLSTRGAVRREALGEALAACLRQMGGPVPTEAEAQAAIASWAMTPHLRETPDGLALARRPEALLPTLLEEIALWRLEGLHSRERTLGAAEAPAAFLGGPRLWQDYMREEIPPLFGATFNPGSWNQGMVRLGHRLILLTTLAKGNMASGNHYEDRFLSPTRMQWQSQSQTRQDSAHARMLSGATPGQEVHLFVRGEKLRGGTAAPFLYLGQPRFAGWEGERPITVTWDLPEPVPAHLRRMLRVPEG